MEICRSDDVFRRLADPAFQAFWDSLYEGCPWRTVFQSRCFVATWYEQYRSSYEPILIFSMDPASPGLLPLAGRPEEIVVAGAHQAEYQAWLAREGDPGFLPQALRLLGAEGGFKSLSFKYLPAGFPIQVLPEGRSEVQAIPRPLMRVDPSDHLTQSLKKKSNKSRLNGLRQRGELVLDHVTDERLFEELFDELILMYDFRQGAVNNSVPFEEDKHKKAFHLALAKLPGLMHCSVLRSGNEIVAGLLGLCTGDTVHSGVFAHSPLYGKYSPGKLHLLLLGLQMQKEGFAYLDLTPGGSEWKDRFATDHDEVYRATIYLTGAAALRNSVHRGLVRFAKKAAQRLNLTPKRIRQSIAPLNRLRPQSLLEQCRSWLSSRTELRVYRLPGRSIKAVPNSPGIAKDAIRHLLLFRPLASNQTRTRFLSTALQRLEGGLQHFYSREQDGKVVEYCWLVERTETMEFSEIHQGVCFPPNAAILFDYHTDPRYRAAGDTHPTLLQTIVDAEGPPGTEGVYFCAAAESQSFGEAIEKMGMAYQGSAFYVRRMGRERKWSTFSAPDAPRLSVKAQVDPS
jgi:CelD/BcsL family acetyltransferase involved in cellulose biosynthesis